MMACCFVASRQIFDFTVAQPHELRLACRGCTAQLHSGHNAPILQARTHGYVCPPRVHLAFLTLVYNNTPAIPDEVLHSRCTSADDRKVLFEEFVATTVLRSSHVHSRAFQEILEVRAWHCYAYALLAWMHFYRQACHKRGMCQNLGHRAPTYFLTVGSWCRLLRLVS